MASESRCGVDERREAVRKGPGNGIDYLEVLDSDAPAGSPRQRTLLVRCLKDLPPMPPGGNYPIAATIESTGRALPVGVVWVAPGEDATLPTPRFLSATEKAFLQNQLDHPLKQLLVIRTDSSGDYSTYTLRLTRPGTSAGPTAFDPALVTLDFTFKAECPSDADCEVAVACPPKRIAERPIDYLAKDYSSFRRLMLDRMSELMPAWTERNAADVGVTLVELLAYVGDQLSYQQDAVATEAYLGTARQRISVRRHAKLVDYHMSDGSNARAWVQVLLNGDALPLPANTVLSTNIPGELPAATAESMAWQRADAVFCTMHESGILYAAHQDMPFYTWGDTSCCLPAGATRASLKGDFSTLQVGHVLVFEEVLGPKSGKAQDADPTRRHAVRLTAVTARVDPLNAQKVTDIEWARADALPWPLCLSATWQVNGVPQVSLGHGNIVLADHGQWVEDGPRTLGKGSWLRLAEQPLTHASRIRRTKIDAASGHSSIELVFFDPDLPASSAFSREQSDVVPVMTLALSGSTNWTPVRDLLSSGPLDPVFVAEIPDDGRAIVRFGDGRNGLRPPAGAMFTARYRVGNGAHGNVGAETLRHVFTDVEHVTGVRNFLPARGGSDPESMAEVRRRAPFAFRTQERAVTESDYAARAERNDDVQRAMASFRWTGSWHTVFVAVDPFDRVQDTGALTATVVQELERYRMAGYDLEVDTPRFVPLEIEMVVCVKPDYIAREVTRALRRVFTRGRQPDGRPGLFHPDNFTFAQKVFLSPYYASAQAIPGVASVEIRRFGRWGSADLGALETGTLDLGALEIARLDDDPGFPERGVFTLRVGGGR